MRTACFVGFSRDFVGDIFVVSWIDTLSLSFSLSLSEYPNLDIIQDILNAPEPR